MWGVLPTSRFAADLMMKTARVGKVGKRILGVMSDDDTRTLGTLVRVQVGRRPGRLVLRVVEGHKAGERVVLVGRRVTIGRSSANDFSLDDPSLSAQHLEFLIRSSGVELRDRGSRNGTFVNGRRAMHVCVEPGDEVHLGDCALVVEALEDIEVSRSSGGCFGALVGDDEAMRELFGQLEVLASTPLDVLVTGETGTGKELVAEALHSHSSRRDQPFVVLDCGSLPSTLAESALFGHAQGAFTGATGARRGAFEQADGGVLFVDEVGELSKDLQVKLLGVLARREFHRLGEEVSRTVDVRVVAATHRNLADLVAQGSFREDLYYRLAKSRVEIPPLRERPADIERLAELFLSRLTGLPRKPVFSADALVALREHSWPGNVRELQDAVTHAAYTAKDGVLRATDLCLVERLGRGARLDQLIRVGSYRDAHDELDRYLIPQVLSEFDGKLLPAAKKLGVDRKKLRSAIRRLKLFSIDADDG